MGCKYGLPNLKAQRIKYTKYIEDILQRQNKYVMCVRFGLRWKCCFYFCITRRRYSKPTRMTAVADGFFIVVLSRWRTHTHTQTFIYGKRNVVYFMRKFFKRNKQEKMFADYSTPYTWWTRQNAKTKKNHTINLVSNPKPYFTVAHFGLKEINLWSVIMWHRTLHHFCTK